MQVQACIRINLIFIICVKFRYISFASKVNLLLRKMVKSRGNPNTKSSADIHLGCDVDFSIMSRDQFFDESETNPGTFAAVRWLRLDAVKALENVWKM